MARQDIFFGNPQLRNSFEQAGRRGGRAEDAYLQGALTYNPMKSLRSFAEGAYGDFSRRLNKDMGTLRGQQVGMGRLNTGFGTRDEDRVTTDLASAYQDAILQQSMNAENLRFQNMQGLGNYGAATSGSYRQGLADLEATRADREAQERASKRAFWGGIISGGLSGAGSALSRPARPNSSGTSFSDKTLKRDIRDAEPVLPRVRRLRAKSWRWNEEGKRLTGDGDGRRHGVIAQEVERGFPEFVIRRDDSGKLKVDYGALTSTLVTAIGELDEKIDRLKLGPAAAALARA